MNQFLYMMLFASSRQLVSSAEPNPPNWDTDRVKILDPNDSANS